MLLLCSYLAKDMKKKKQKHRFKDMDKRSSEKGNDLMEAYTEKPPKEEVKQFHSCSGTCLKTLLAAYIHARHTWLLFFLKPKKICLLRVKNI